MILFFYAVFATLSFFVANAQIQTLPIVFNLVFLCTTIAGFSLATGSFMKKNKKEFFEISYNSYIASILFIFFMFNLYLNSLIDKLKDELFIFLATYIAPIIAIISLLIGAIAFVISIYNLLQLLHNLTK